MTSTAPRRRLRILAVTTWYPTPAAPVAGVFVRKDVHALAEDHDVLLVHLAPPAAFASAPAREQDGPVAVRRLEWDPRRPLTVVAALRALRRAERGADLVHTMAFSSLLPYAARRPAVPWVHTEHWSGLTAPESLVAPLRRVMPGLRHLLALPDVVVPVCEFLARPIRAVRSGRTEVIPCIVDQPASVPARRDTPGWDLVSVGGLVAGKDPATAVRALAELRARGHDATLTWVGGGPLRDQVEQLADELGVAAALTLTGPVTPAEVATHLDAADLFLLPTRFDNFCVSGAEALAHGRPVVIGAHGGQAEYVTPEVGTLVAEQTPGAYADAVEATRSRLRHASADEIAADVRTRFTTAAVRRACAATYDSLLGSPAAGRYRSAASVDVVIAIHTPDREIERAVASVLADDTPDTRALVVVHNTDVAPIEGRLREAGLVPSDRVVLVEHHDGIRSPAGPFTAGLAASDAAHVAVMGSDDFLRPGALAAWLGHATAGAEAVIARVEHQAGGLVRTPPTRLGRRHRRLDLVRDRLAYRTAPLGLLSAAMLERVGATFLAGVATAEDLDFGLRVWHGAQGIVYAGDDPAYVVGADAPTRVTMTVRPVADDLAAALALVADPWFQGLPVARRRAVVVKVLRIHVFGAVVNRVATTWTAAERDSLAACARTIVAGAPTATSAFSRAEQALWDAIVDPSVPDDQLVARSQARLRHGRPDTVLTADPLRVLDRQAPARLMVSSALMS
ncbi:glycosyltransferase [Arsenicicoccus sp. oral taxon 190]|uniref:glycosyltransferase n=1 Tax=Arsenicicoccus sp. oral taxon 190 TaxID=1658671 RepID=UPI00067C61D3|nr:glycosyltransferase [Arsenicicoccus sp. oral taxon 190]